jgi:hypothetical protein
MMWPSRPSLAGLAFELNRYLNGATSPHLHFSLARACRLDDALILVTV